MLCLSLAGCSHLTRTKTIADLCPTPQNKTLGDSGLPAGVQWDFRVDPHRATSGRGVTLVWTFRNTASVARYVEFAGSERPLLDAWLIDIRGKTVWKALEGPQELAILGLPIAPRDSLTFAKTWDGSISPSVPVAPGCYIMRAFLRPPAINAERNVTRDVVLEITKAAAAALRSRSEHSMGR